MNVTGWGVFEAAALSTRERFVRLSAAERSVFCVLSMVVSMGLRGAAGYLFFKLPIHTAVAL